MSQAGRETRLIINGDDYGLSPGVNRGIEHLHEKGRLTSVSLLVNSPWSAEAIEYARLHKDFRAGVHLNLTTNWPVLPSDQVASLVDSHGNFYNTSTFLFRLLTGRINSTELENELSAQIGTFVDNEIRPVHIDSHMHLHAVPTLRRLMDKLARRFGIGIVRNADLSAIVLPPLGNSRPVQSFVRKTGNHVLRSTQRMFAGDDQIDNGQLQSADRVLYLRWCIEHGRSPYAGFEACIESLRGRTVEVVAHPAVIDEHLPAQSNYVKGRRRELDFLDSDRFAELLEEGVVSLAME